MPLRVLPARYSKRPTPALIEPVLLVLFFALDHITLVPNEASQNSCEGLESPLLSLSRSLQPPRSYMLRPSEKPDDLFLKF